MVEQEQKSKPLQEQTKLKDVPAVWPPPPRRRPRQGPAKPVKIVAMILALLLIASGLGLLIYATTNQYSVALGAQQVQNIEATVNSQATTVGSLRATAQPLATAQARIYATATAQAQSSVTVPTAGIEATATATTMENQFTQDTTGTPTLDDPLSDNSMGNQWDTGYSDNNNTGCNFVDGSYQVQEALPGFLHTCFADTTDFSNFVYQVSMTLSSGNGGGILLRANALKGQYYLFRIDTNGNYVFELYNGSAYTLLASGTNSAISTGSGSFNTLAVIADKGTFSLFVNSSYVAGASDKTLSSGEIGMAAYNTDLPVTLDFSDAQVWKLSS